MKKLLHQSIFLSIWIEEDLNLLSNFWAAESTNMEDEDFKKEIAIFGEFVKKYKTPFLLGNTQSFFFTISSEVQHWHDQTIVPIYLASGVKKLALILSTNIFSQVSIEQTLEEKDASVIETRYFDDIENAKKWLLA